MPPCHRLKYFVGWKKAVSMETKFVTVKVVVSCFSVCSILVKAPKIILKKVICINNGQNNAKRQMLKELCRWTFAMLTCMTSLPVVDLRGRKGRPPAKISSFSCIFGKNWSNNRFGAPRGWHTPLWEILDPPLIRAFCVNKFPPMAAA